MKMKASRKFRFYQLHPDGGGVGGLVHKKPKMRKQDKRARSGDFYAVVFFPRISLIGPATLVWPGTVDSLANSPEAAKTIFMDRIRKGEKWETYAKAGHRVRRIRISDLGDA
jgi:hypothetical protein